MKQLDVLSVIADRFNEKKITWALGASMMLYFHGLIEKPRDIDIIVSLNDISIADEILSDIGYKHEKDESMDYSTSFFHEYTLDGIDIDLMAGFKINMTDMVFEYRFNHNSPIDFYNLKGIRIPLSPVEDWFLLYQLMQKRENKVRMTEEYLLSNGVIYTEILQAALKIAIPESVKSRIRKVLTNCKHSVSKL